MGITFLMTGKLLLNVEVNAPDECSAPGAATPLHPHQPASGMRGLPCAASRGFQRALEGVGDAGPRPSALRSQSQGTPASPHSCPDRLATVPPLRRAPVCTVPPTPSPGRLPGSSSPDLLCKAVSFLASLRPASGAAPGP